jgi:hypothetical protein
LGHPVYFKHATPTPTASRWFVKNAWCQRISRYAKHFHCFVKDQLSLILLCCKAVDPFQFLRISFI